MLRTTLRDSGTLPCAGNGVVVVVVAVGASIWPDFNCTSGRALMFVCTAAAQN